MVVSNSPIESTVTIAIWRPPSLKTTACAPMGSSVRFELANVVAEVFMPGAESADVSGRWFSPEPPAIYGAS